MTKLEIFLLFIIIVTQWALSYYTHYPLYGFDDANITQAYAQNIVNGHGYVYNIGGERVEGSTSILWTFVNVIAFLTTSPIEFLQLISVLVVVCIMVVSTLIIKEITNSTYATQINLISFNFFPFFFGWGLFSLMDTNLFILLIVLAVYTIICPPTSKSFKTMFLVLFILPLARPEGVLVSIGVLLVWVLFYSDRYKRVSLGPALLVCIISSLLLITVIRLYYFGYPFPNTYYAKTSNDQVGQIIQGLYYLKTTVMMPQIFTMLILFGLSSVFFISSKNTAIRNYIFSVSLIILGAVITYVYLGGDHFKGGRFFQFVIPLILPVVSVFVVETLSEALNRKSKFKFIISAPIGIVIMVIIFGQYFVSGGGFRHEFRIAENGREQSMYINQLFGDSMSLGLTAAGGTRMGYDGIIYDVLGLNWVEMAHSEKSTNTSLLKNHGGFDGGVFLKKKLDIFAPEMKSCSEILKLGFFDKFRQEITLGVTLTEEFKSIYDVYCDDRITFFGLKKHHHLFLSLNFKTV
jgi:arabinofuranosyltransferase